MEGETKGWTGFIPRIRVAGILTLLRHEGLPQEGPYPHNFPLAFFPEPWYGLAPISRGQ